MIPKISITEMIKATIFSLIIIIIILIHQNQQSKIVFCDVNQGLAVYMKLDEYDILFDTGPGREVLTCLGKHMPFYDRSLDIVFISHNQTDHIGGLEFLQKRYQINRLIISHSLKDKIKNNIKKYYININDQIRVKNNQFTLLWPDSNYQALDDNDQSLVLCLKTKKYKILLLGDNSFTSVNRLSKQSISSTDILLVPHHGSKYGLSYGFLKLADPKVAVISVGSNNSYGHPAKRTLDLLEDLNIKIRRTDTEGDIVFKID